MLIVRTLIIASTLLALPSFPDMKQVETILDTKSAQQADVLDIVSSGGSISHVAYEARVPTVTPALPSPLPNLNLPPRLTRFGSITGGANGYSKTGNQPGGLMIDLGATNKIRNLLAYQSLNIAGSWNGTWQVALADEAQAKRKEQTILSILGSKATATILLNQAIAAKTDLSRARYLIFSLTSPKGLLNLRSITFNRAELPMPPPQHGVWIFNNQRLLKSPELLAEELASKGFRRAYVQIADDPDRLYPFVTAAARYRIEVYALEGSPEHLNHGAPLLARVAAIIAYNRLYPEAPFAGLQLDIAPHDLRDYGIRRSYYNERFLTLLNEVASQCRLVMPLSIIVPHWFTRIPINGQNMTAKTLAQADELVVTCDLTQFSELVQRSRESLIWGERFNKPIYLGIKAGPIPDEGHVIIKRSTKKNGKSFVTLAGMQWERETSYTVPSGTVSFSGKLDALNDLLTKAPPSPAFNGWIINSYENLK